jgi:hypothetical protein
MVGPPMVTMAPNVSWETHDIKEMKSNGSTQATIARPFVEEYVESSWESMLG